MKENGIMHFTSLEGIFLTSNMEVRYDSPS